MRKVIATTLMLTLLAGVALAQRGGPGCEPWADHFGSHSRMTDRFDGHQRGLAGRAGGFRHILRFADEINLSEEQRTMLEELGYDFRLEQIDRRAEVKKAEVGLRALIRNEDTEEREVFDAIDRLSALKADLQKSRYTYQKQVKEILTEEQLDKLRELRKRPGEREVEERKVIRRRMKKG